MIKVGILGYGNLARGVEKAILASSDMRLDVIFSRRPDIKIASGAHVEAIERLDAYAGKLDVVVCCGGSATDLGWQTPMIAERFNFVDSFDNHSQIPQHFTSVDFAAKKAGTSGIISAGWDPGLFSLMRLFGEAALPMGETYTFWGRGVSQGHSDAIRRISGVLRAVQYTVPVQSAVDEVCGGGRPKLTARQKHTRECFVVAKEGADRAAIEREIVTMPAYFADYDTTVTFISEDEFAKNHTKMPHGGCVIRSGETDAGAGHTVEFALNLSNNPEFTGSVLAAYARAAARLSANGARGAHTVFDVPPAYLSPKTPMALYKELL